MTEDRSTASTLTLTEFTRRSLIVGACALAVILLTWFFWTTAHAALLIFSAFLVAVGLNGLARLTQRALPISRHGAVAVVATVLALFLGLSITAITMNIASQAPELKQQVAQSIDQLQSRLDDYKMTQTFLSSSVMGESGQGESGQSIGQRLTGKLSGAVSVTMSTLTDFFVIVIIGLYLALQPSLYRDGLLRLFPPSQRQRAWDISEEAADAVRRWLTGRVVSMTVTGIASAAGLALIGIPFAFLLGLLAGLFTTVIGNLDGFVQIAQGAWHKLADGRAFPPFDFWRSSRMLDIQENFDPSPLAFWVPDKVDGFTDMSSHITEFPFFTFLFADLHAHMMAIPFTLLVIGLGLNLVVGLRSNGRLWAAVSSVALALALGSLWVINSWDYPSYLLLTLALLALAVYFKPGSAVSRLLLLAVLSAGVLLVSLLAFLPFHQSYEAFNTGLDASKWRTPIDRFLGIHGLFLFIIATFLIYNARGTLLSVVHGLLPWTRRAFGHPEFPVPSGLRWALALGLLGAVLLALYWRQRRHLPARTPSPASHLPTTNRPPSRT